MRRLRILIVTQEHLVPPESIEGLTDQEVLPYKMDFDISASLQELGHDVQFLGVKNDFDELRHGIDEVRPHIVFNVLEEFAGSEVSVSYVLGYLELIKQKYTGCNPVGMLFSHDKALQRKILRHHRIPVPDFALVRKEKLFKLPKRLEFPLIVKSLTEHGSFGISQASVVHDEEKLHDRISFVHEQLGTDAIVEQFIEGRELYVGILGNERLTSLPLWELHFENLPEGAPAIATEKIKWDLNYQKRVGVRTGHAEDLDPALRDRILRQCKRAYRALDQSGYARLDVRLDDRGRAYIIESNPNPQLSFGEDFAEAAEAAGLSYHKLLQRIVNLGMRWKPRHA